MRKEFDNFKKFTLMDETPSTPPSDKTTMITDVKKLAEQTLYTEEQVREIAKYTISQWTSLNEQRQHDHQDLVDVWLDNDLCNFIQSLKGGQK